MLSDCGSGAVVRKFAKPSSAFHKAGKGTLCPVLCLRPCVEMALSFASCLMSCEIAAAPAGVKGMLLLNAVTVSQPSRFLL